MINSSSAYEATGWLDRAACAVFPAPMFPSEGDAIGIETAKAVCDICPVRFECLQAALDRGEQWGVWGGMTAEERKSFRRKQQRSGKLVQDLNFPEGN